MNSTLLHIIIVAVAAFLIGWALGRASGKRSGGGMQVQAYAPTATLSTALPPDQWPPYIARQFEQYLHQGKKIEAIKIYREQTGVGLKDAKDAVEAIMASRSL